MDEIHEDIAEIDEVRAMQKKSHAEDMQRLEEAENAQRSEREVILRLDQEFKQRLEE